MVLTSIQSGTGTRTWQGGGGRWPGGAERDVTDLLPREAKPTLLKGRRRHDRSPSVPELLLLRTTIDRTLARHRLSPGVLCLEITESALITDDLSHRFLHGLREQGVRLSIDEPTCSCCRPAVPDPSVAVQQGWRARAAGLVAQGRRLIRAAALSGGWDPGGDRDRDRFSRPVPAGHEARLLHSSRSESRYAWRRCTSCSA
jgi:hypothetical protein